MRAWAGVSNISWDREYVMRNLLSNLYQNNALTGAYLEDELSRGNVQYTMLSVRLDCLLAGDAPTFILPQAAFDQLTYLDAGRDCLFDPPTWHLTLARYPLRIKSQNDAETFRYLLQQTRSIANKLLPNHSCLLGLVGVHQKFAKYLHLEFDDASEALLKDFSEVVCAAWNEAVASAHLPPYFRFTKTDSPHVSVAYSKQPDYFYNLRFPEPVSVPFRAVFFPEPAAADVGVSAEALAMPSLSLYINGSSWYLGEHHRKQTHADTEHWQSYLFVDGPPSVGAAASVDRGRQRPIRPGI